MIYQPSNSIFESERLVDCLGDRVESFSSLGRKVFCSASQTLFKSLRFRDLRSVKIELGLKNFIIQLVDRIDALFEFRGFDT